MKRTFLLLFSFLIAPTAFGPAWGAFTSTLPAMVDDSVPGDGSGTLLNKEELDTKRFQKLIANDNYLQGTTEGGPVGGVYRVSTSASITDYGNAAQGGSLAWVLAQVGSAQTTVSLPGPKTYTITTNVTVPANVSLRLQRGAVFAGAGDLTINGPLEADLTTHFSGSGALVLASVPEVYPEWWGAVAGDATDDATAINAAQGTGRTVRGDDGTYVLSAAVVMDVAGQSLTGVPGKTVFDASGSTNDGVRITADNVTVEGVTVNGAVRYGIYSINAASPRIKDCTVTDSGNIGIFWEMASASAAIEGPEISGCTVDRTSLGSTITEGGIKVHGDTGNYQALRARIHDNKVFMPSDAADDAANCIESFGDSDWAVISDNITVGGSMGISLAQADHNSVTGNTIYNPNDWGIEIAGSDHTAAIGNTIDGNGNCDDGIIVSAIGSVYSNDTAITGGTITGCTNAVQVNSTNDGVTITGAAMSITAANYAVNLTGVQDFAVTGNTISGGGTGLKGVMLDRSYDGTVVGNTIQGFTQNAVLMYSTTTDTLDNVTITGNAFFDCGTPVTTQLSGGAVLGANVRVYGNAGQASFLNFRDYVLDRQGTGSPEGVVTAGIGSTHRQYDPTAGSSPLWVKASGTGNTGWVRLGAAIHSHTLSDVSDAGTSASYDVPAAGDAGVGEVVVGNDTRLTDARTPSAHAASHGEGQSDAITPTAIGAAALSTDSAQQVKGVWYVSTAASITDHGNAAQVGSLAWVLAQAGGAQTTIRLPGPKAYPITTATTIPATVVLRLGQGAAFDDPSKLTVDGAIEWDGAGGTVDVRAYGAIPGDALDDGAAINLALAEAGTAGGGVVFLPKGTYIIETPLLVPSDVTLLGVGAASILYAKTNLNAPVLQNVEWASGTNTDITIRDLAVDGNSAGQASGYRVGILLRGVTGFLIENVKVSDTAEVGIFLPGDHDGTVQRCTVSGVVGATHPGVYVGYQVAGHAMEGQSDRVKLLGNTSHSNGQDGLLYQYGTDGLMEGNIVHSNGASGLKTGAGARRINIQGNVVYGNITGIHAQQSSEIQIVGNYSYRNDNSGIQVSDAATAGQTMEKFLIADNVVSENGQNGGGQPYGIHFLGSDGTSAVFRHITITGNHMTDYQGAGATQYWGLKFRKGTFDQILVDGNFFYGNKTSAYNATDAPTNITWGTNFGYSPPTAAVPQVRQYHFFVSNVLANQASSVWLDNEIATGSQGIAMPKAGSIRGVYAKLGADITAGTLTIIPKKNATNPTPNLSMTSTDGSAASVEWDAGTYAFAAGDFLGMAYTSDANLLPTGSSELWVTMEVEY